MIFETKLKQSNVELVPMDIIVGGKVVGDLTPRIYGYDGSLSWHACIRLPAKHLGANLIQGHGSTHEDAIKDAIRNGRAMAQEHLELTNAFAMAVGFSAE